MKSRAIKKIVALVIIAALAVTMAVTLAACNDEGGSGGNTVYGNKIGILVPNADHGWTGAVLDYAESYAAQINAEGEFKATVVTATDSANQISQVEDIIANKTYDAVVILPYDNMLENAMLQLQNSGIPYVMFDRVIASASNGAVSNVMGDNEGIGAATAARFIEQGLKPGDKILIMPGDNSSVPEARNKGFKDYLLAHGWTEAQYNASVTSTAYTGWSRATGKQLFIEQVGLGTFNDTKYIFTHDDEIAMGILEALKSTELNDAQKAAFLDGSIVLGSSSGLNEIYSVLKGIHRNDYKAELAGLKDLFSVTYDPAMIEDAIDDMINFLSGKTHIIDVDVVDKDNVNDYVGFGDAVAKS